MRVVNKTVALVLAVIVFASSTASAQHIADPAAINQAMTDKITRDAEKRDLVLRVLERTEVREMAGRLGMDVERAGSAIATLDGAELNELAAHAQAVDTSLAGGATIVISLTALLLLLILVILIAR